MTTFPNKMVRSALRLWLVYAVAPAVFIAIEAPVALEGGFGADPTLVRIVFLVLALVSAANFGFTVYMQTRKPRTQAGNIPSQVGRIIITTETNSILSEAHAVFGIILTFLSGSIFYGIGFSLVSWASLLWVRRKFKQNLGKLSADQSNAMS